MNERTTKTRRQAWSVRLICRQSGYISNSTPWPSISMTSTRGFNVRNVSTNSDSHPTRLARQCRAAKVIPRHQGTPGIFGHHLTAPFISSFPNWVPTLEKRRAPQLHFSVFTAGLYKMAHRRFFSMFETSWALVAPPLRHWNMLRCDVQFFSMRNL